MKRILPKLLTVFFLTLLVFLFKSSLANASYTLEIDPPAKSSDPFNGLPTHPSAIQLFKDLNVSDQTPIITENTNTIIIHLKDLAENTTYSIDPFHKFTEVTSKGRTLDIAVCADGQDLLKLAGGDANNPGEGKCASDDYFWSGTYNFKLRKGDRSGPIVESVPIYVARYYPNFTLGSTDPLNVTLQGSRKPADNERRNNYSIEISRMLDLGKEIDEQCTTVKPDGTNDPEITFKSLELGGYELRINERQKDGGGFAGLFRQDCNTGFTFYSVRLTLDSNGKVTIGDIIADPYGKDIAGQTEKEYKSPAAPCTIDPKTGVGSCPTGLGINISTDAPGLVKSLFSLVLGLSGGIALLLIIYSGYQLIASQGNPEKLQAARDQLISAIIGLVFIIFSLVILEVIGVDILKIPGFSR